jgi:hypothetical protein
MNCVWWHFEIYKKVFFLKENFFFYLNPREKVKSTGKEGMGGARLRRGYGFI